MVNSQGDSAAFPATVRALRLRSGLSLNELARRASIDPAYLHRIEARDRLPPTIPRRPVVLAIGHGLGLGPVLLDDLLARAGYCPDAVLALGGWDQTLAEVALVLSDPDLSDQARAEFRDVLHILANRWSRPTD